MKWHRYAGAVLAATSLVMASCGEQPSTGGSGEPDDPTGYDQYSPEFGYLTTTHWGSLSPEEGEYSLSMRGCNRTEEPVVSTAFVTSNLVATARFEPADNSIEDTYFDVEVGDSTFTSPEIAPGECFNWRFFAYLVDPADRLNFVVSWDDLEAPAPPGPITESTITPLAGEPTFEMGSGETVRVYDYCPTTGEDRRVVVILEGLPRTSTMFTPMGLVIFNGAGQDGSVQWAGIQVPFPAKSQPLYPGDPCIRITITNAFGYNLLGWIGDMPDDGNGWSGAPMPLPFGTLDRVI